MSDGSAMVGRIHPVILSGGSGSRLWPLSRTLYPKQFLPLHTNRSMLVDTALRVRGPHFADALIICNSEHRFIVAEQAREAGLSLDRVVLEPVGRNTAPAAAVAALMLVDGDAGALMMVLPSDHVIGDETAFHGAIATAARAAAEGGALVTFGIAPTVPEVGYGYVRRGDPWPGVEGCFRVDRFVEKPDRATAEGYLADGGYAWNSGIFLFKAARYLEELNRFRPEIVPACRTALSSGGRDLEFERLDERAFRACESDSIDYAVMERTDSAAVVPVDMGWSDVGSWSALWEIGHRDDRGNVAAGDVMLEAVRNSYIRSEGPLVAAIGIEDAVIVVTPDAVLVTSRDRSQDVKTIVEGLKDAARTEHQTHPTIYRPWGHWQTVDSGPGFRVNHIMIKPGARMSLQSHRKRAEHWVIVGGIARVTRDDQVLTMAENQSIYIPVGTRHRLENPGSEPLRVIEVQSGAHIDPDDIVRHEEVY